MLRVFGQLVPSFDPRILVSDLELAVINAFERFYPNARISGCFFHLGQNVQKKVANFGLSWAYSIEPNGRMLVKALKALAFIPMSVVYEMFLWLFHHDLMP